MTRESKTAQEAFAAAVRQESKAKTALDREEKRCWAARRSHEAALTKLHEARERLVRVAIDEALA